uniref:LYR motif containing 1 n=1 Tax=Varanus komodoensis TaxID=61221 RepID=A0A8D2J4Z6_VARKO
MTPVTRQEVLGLYRKIFRIAKKWQSASRQMEETIKEKQYIINEAKTLFQKNKNLTDPELIKQCVEECKARVEIGLHYHIPYPRPVSRILILFVPMLSRISHILSLNWGIRAAAFLAAISIKCMSQVESGL